MSQCSLSRDLLAQFAELGYGLRATLASAQGPHAVLGLGCALNFSAHGSPVTEEPLDNFATVL
jgi:hypothetical protein